MTPPEGRYDLERFVAAQDAGATYDHAVAELHRGRKQSHWMWFVFPQMAGLGGSPTARLYGVSSLDEARAILGHPVLGPRLTECLEAVLTAPVGSAGELLGPIDAMKLRSSATLFLRAAVRPADVERCQRVLDRFFGGEADPATDRLLREQAV